VEGDHKIHVALIREHDLRLARRLEVEFNAAFESGPARPHRIAIK